MTRHWYSYPLELLDDWDSSDYLIVEYRKLIVRPVETIAGLYTHFGLKMSREYRAWLKENSRLTDEYAGAHRLSLEDVGYDAETVRENFAEVYERFDFSDPD